MTRAFWIGLGLLLPGSTAFAQDAEKPFVIRWFGQSMFQLETPSGKKVVFDPHAIPEFGRAIVDADIVTMSHLHTDHTQISAITDPKAARIFRGLIPGMKGRPPQWAKIDEKVGAIRVRNVGLFHDTEEGMTRGRNSAFVLEMNGLTICHLGDLGHELNSEQIRALGPVDLLMVPIGGIYTLNGSMARRVVEQLKPRRYVFPMHYSVPGYDELLPADEFLDGLKNVKKVAGNAFSFSIEPMKDEEPAQTIILGWKKE